jgi:hypothetical protein
LILVLFFLPLLMGRRKALVGTRARLNIPGDEVHWRRRLVRGDDEVETSCLLPGETLGRMCG